MTKGLLQYGVVALVTAPLWVPAAFVGYVGYRLTRTAFAHPWITSGVLTGAALLYASGYGEQLFSKGKRTEVSQLEEHVRETPQESTDAFTYHYLKPGDTLSGLATRIGTRDVDEIMRVNGIDDPRTIPAGYLVRIPKHLQTRRVEDVYTQTPPLRSVVVPRGQRLEDAFGEEADEIVDFNRKLGLDYASFRGERVVYLP